MAIANLRIYIVISSLLGATQNFSVLVAIATCNTCLVVQYSYTWLKNTIKEVNNKEGQKQYSHKGWSGRM